MERFIHAARQLSILSYQDEADEETWDEEPPTIPSPYPEIDAEIARLIHEPDLPYWLRTRQQKHKRKRK